MVRMPQLYNTRPPGSCHDGADHGASMFRMRHMSGYPAPQRSTLWNAVRVQQRDPPINLASYR
eukprot:2957927-Amphidinium_carterae.1